MSHVDLTYGKLQTYDLETQEKVFNSLVFDQNEMDSILADVQGDSLVARVRDLCDMYKGTSRRLTQMQGHYKPYDELVELLRMPGLEPTPRAVVTHFVGLTDQLKELGTAINQQPYETPLQAYTRTVDSFVITDADGNTLDYEISDGCIVLDDTTTVLPAGVKGRFTELNKILGLPEHTHLKDTYEVLTERIKQAGYDAYELKRCGYAAKKLQNLMRVGETLSIESVLLMAVDELSKPNAPYVQLIGRSPRTPEQRYMVDDDIKPCTVLYSDDETTLVRTDDGDHMFNTGAIAWSDEDTYRVQELLKRNDIAYNGTAVWCIKELAKLGHLVITDEGFERGPVPEVDDTPNQFESLANSQAATLVKQDERSGYDRYCQACRDLGTKPFNRIQWVRRGCPLSGSVCRD